MHSVKAKKLHSCKKCYKDIWPGTECHPRSRGEALCLDCGKAPTLKSFIVKLLECLGDHGK